jgi:hypothetical protein
MGQDGNWSRATVVVRKNPQRRSAYLPDSRHSG